MKKLGKIKPEQKTIDSLKVAIDRLGLSGLVVTTKISWSVVAGAALGLPVKGESLENLEHKIKELGF